MMYYGWRGKVGLVLPQTGSAPEHEYHKYLPDGVTIITTRILFEKVDPQGLEEMSRRVMEGAALIGTAGLDIVVFPCTTGSLIKGYGYDRQLIEEIKRASGVKKAMTTTTAVVRALKAVGAKKIIVTTPYSTEVDAIEKKFLEDSGFEVLAIRGLGYTDPLCMPRVTPDQMYRLTKETDLPEADAVFVSCTGLGIIDSIPMLEQDLGKSVITSNQATWWATLRELGIRDDLKLGRLFRL
ncbi:MAG: maleate cis-trans isomerase [Clostridia bacterium]|nr:maleate cis-trans isomerase [Clostridia bacterium]